MNEAATTKYGKQTNKRQQAAVSHGRFPTPQKPCCRKVICLLWRQVASLSHLPRIVKLEGHLPSGCAAPFLNSIFAPRPPSCLINHLSSSAGIVDYNEVLLAVLLVRVCTPRPNRNLQYVTHDLLCHAAIPGLLSRLPFSCAIRTRTPPMCWHATSCRASLLRLGLSSLRG